jgi:radical SAM superfamily enzyme YgiQ (UPF0313 family)
MKILLVSPPNLRLFGLSNRNFPLGLGYLASALSSAGHECIIYNADFATSQARWGWTDAEKIMLEGNSGYNETLRDLKKPVWQEIKRVISDVSPDIIGITCMTSTMGAAINVARCAKTIDPKIKVIAGGVHPTILPDEVLLLPEVDIVIKGEGERAIIDVVDALSRNVLHRLPSAKRIGEKTIVEPDQKMLVENIDSISFPARGQLLNKDKYDRDSFGMLIGSRGCPFDCIFCSSHKMWGRKVRFRSAGNIVREIASVKKEFGTEFFEFVDDSFTLRKDIVYDLCSRLLSERLNVRWVCPTRVDLIDRHIVKEMKKSGCVRISLGIESGSEETLRRTHKHLTKDAIRNAIKIINEEGVKTMGYFIFGFPWENQHHVYETLDFIHEIDLDIVQYNFAVPLPGTELFKTLESEQRLPPHATPFEWSNFYQHSPRLSLFSSDLDEGVKKMLVEETKRRLGHYSMVKWRMRQGLHGLSFYRRVIKNCIKSLCEK